jgi:hypothetical protein
MRSIRKFAYAAVLAVSIVSIQPTLASAEDARGVFTLTHGVRWQNCLLRAGDYAFTLKSMGRPTFLMLRGLSGAGTNAMLLVIDVEQSKPDDVSQLVLVSRNGQSFVSAMELPDSEMTLHFDVPLESPSK